MFTHPRRNRFRSRMLVVAALSAVALVGAGCSGEAGPGAKQGARSESLEDLSTKIGLIQQDACYRAPQTHHGPTCDRYMTQLRNIAGAAVSGHQSTPPINEAGRELQQKLDRWWEHGCAQSTVPDEQQCTADMTEIAQVLRDLRQLLPNGS